MPFLMVVRPQSFLFLIKRKTLCRLEDLDEEHADMSLKSLTQTWVAVVLPACTCWFSRCHLIWGNEYLRGISSIKERSGRKCSVRHKQKSTEQHRWVEQGCLDSYKFMGI